MSLKNKALFYLWGAAAALQSPRPKFTIIPYRAPFCQAKFQKNLHKFFPKILSILPISKSKNFCYNYFRKLREKKIE